MQDLERREDDTNTDEYRPIIMQSAVEHEMLSQARKGLQTALAWQTEGDTFTRKLSSVRFAARSYHEHFERVLSQEEYDGYMDVVTSEHPNWTEKVERLREEHKTFRESWDDLLTKLDRLKPTDQDGFQGLIAGIRELLERFEKHNSAEVSLIQEALNTDMGIGD